MRLKTYARAPRALSLVVCSLLCLSVACGDSDEADDGGNNTATTNSGTTSTNNSNTTNTNSGTGTTSTNNSTTSTNSGTTVPPGVSACGEFEPNVDLADSEACAECVDTACCDEAAACRDSADCYALRQCFDACDRFDRACQDACDDALANDAALAVNTPYLQCRNANCADACQRAVNWTCIETPPPAPVTTPGTLRFEAQVRDFQTGASVSTGTVTACATDDTECASPVATAEINDGVVVLEIPVEGEGFDGYVEVRADGVLPSIIYPNRPLVEDRSTNFTVLSEATINAFTAILGVDQDAERGILTSFVYDCSIRLAPGATLSVGSGDAQTQAGYIAGSLPSPDATATDGSGLGGVFNVPVGVTSTVASRAEDGVEVDRRDDVIFRAGWVTSVTFNPSLR